ncbi:MAG: NADH-quinone oxidoreductase subunit L, partial [Betaproteobacteria bacterium]
YMPLTWITSLVGSLALIGTPFLSGFYSKELIIEAAKFANVPGAGFAYFAVLAGVFVTAFYSFRMYFLVFHGKERWGQSSHHHAHDDASQHDDHHHGLAAGDKPHESPFVVTLPLLLLAIPSLAIGFLSVGPMLFGGYFDGVIAVLDSHPALAEIAKHFHGPAAMGVHAFQTLPFVLMIAGVASAWYMYLINPALPAAIKSRFEGVHRLLENKYYLDRINEVVFAAGARFLGRSLWKRGDQELIDGVAVNGSAKLIGGFASILRHIQTGRLNTYAITMIVGVAVLLLFVVLPIVRH